MASSARSLLAIGLVLGGLGLAAFFGLLLMIADCSAACEARGERAPAIALVGAGLGLAIAGVLVPRRGARQALAIGLLLAGGLAAIVGLAYAARGAVAFGGATGAAGVVAAIVGGAFLRHAR